MQAGWQDSSATFLCLVLVGGGVVASALTLSVVPGIGACDCGGAHVNRHVLRHLSKSASWLAGQLRKLPVSCFDVVFCCGLH